MATRNVSLTETLDRFVEAQVASGDFQNASEVVREGLRLLKQRTEEDSARIAHLKAAIRIGVDELDRGQGEVVKDIDAWLGAIEAEIDAEA
jgi:antitoxin ParD1/3/4